MAGAGVGALLAGCAGGGPPPETVTVTIESAGNTPARVRLAAGGTVTWENEDGDLLHEHTVTAATLTDGATAWSFDAELPEEGDSVSYTFESDGVYQYYDRREGKRCRCGVVVVGDASFDGVLPCEPVAGGGRC